MSITFFTDYFTPMAEVESHLHRVGLTEAALEFGACKAAETSGEVLGCACAILGRIPENELDDEAKAVVHAFIRNATGS